MCLFNSMEVKKYFVNVAMILTCRQPTREISYIIICAGCTLLLHNDNPPDWQCYVVHASASQMTRGYAMYALGKYTNN